VKWIGLRGDDLQLVPESALQELKPRDFQVAKSLLSSKFLQVCFFFLQLLSNVVALGATNFRLDAPDLGLFSNAGESES
jgi:hypothetical protein